MKTSRRGKLLDKFYMALAKWHKQVYLDNRCDCRCECCNSKYPLELLQFHHPNPSDKEFQLSVKRWRGLEGPPKKTIDEAAKCVVLCSPCHDLEHIAWKYNESILNDKETYNRFRDHRVKEPKREDYMDDRDEGPPKWTQEELLLSF